MRLIIEAKKVQLFVNRCFLLIALMFSLQGCQTSKEILASCHEDFKRFVKGGEHCYAIEAEIPKSLHKDPTLFVMLHGDGGTEANEVLYNILSKDIEGLAEGGTVITVKLTRNGFENRNGDKTDGFNRDGGTSFTVDYSEGIANAIMRLKTKYGAKKVVVYGQSGGATMAAITLGTSPNTIDIAILNACNCNVPQWRIMHGWPVHNFYSPHYVVDQVTPSTTVYVLNGSNDTNTFPILAQQYVQSLQAAGVKDAYYLEVNRATHNTLKWAKENRTAIAYALGLKITEKQFVKLPWIKDPAALVAGNK